MRDNPRLDQLGDYPFQRLRALLDGVPAPADVEPVAMHLGEPQLPQPDFVAATIAEHANLWNRYPPAAGTAEIREAASAWLTRRYRLPDGMIDPGRHITPVAGTREALFHAALIATPPALGHNGARPAILMPNPMYHVYYAAAVMAGAEPVPVAATLETGFLPDYESLDPAILSRTTLAYLCTPGNPQGAVADMARLERLIRLARKYDFVLALDECYSEIWRGAAPPGGLEACAAMDGGAVDNVLVFHSLSKRSSAPGLRAGFAAGDADAIARLLRLRNYGGAQVPLPIQAAAAALWRDEAHVEASRAHYASLFAMARRILGNRAGYHDAPGGFFLWLNVGDGEEAALNAWRHGAIRVMPGRYMSRDDPATGVNPGAQYIRVALVHDTATAEAGLTRLAASLEG